MGKELKSFVGKTCRYLNNVKSAINSSFPVSFLCLLDGYAVPLATLKKAGSAGIEPAA
jgi:hypothetical protein